MAPASGGNAMGSYSPEMQARIDETKKELKKHTDEKAATDGNLKTFDELDFVVFSNQEWTRLHESHSKDVKVNWPDGHYTMGIENTLQTSRQCSYMRLMRTSRFIRSNSDQVNLLT
jgi:hypothetical protein